ncbi:MAG: hypothetical protein VYC34_08480, partial [Planctomycetota bacterium]|nr:hypothetical protein [Planctomycetota bacterium]
MQIRALRPSRRLTLMVLGALLLLVCPGVATGQQPAPLFQSDEVEVAIDSFGVGDVVRPGDYAGL